MSNADIVLKIRIVKDGKSGLRLELLCCLFCLSSLVLFCPALTLPCLDFENFSTCISTHSFDLRAIPQAFGPSTF
jgi:hypothetical protein